MISRDLRPTCIRSAEGRDPGRSTETHPLSRSRAQLYQRAVSLRPSEVKAYVNLGISLSSSDRMEEAEAALRAAAFEE